MKLEGQCKEDTEFGVLMKVREGIESLYAEYATVLPLALFVEIKTLISEVFCSLEPNGRSAPFWNP
jgi:hypothetical protein